MLYDQTIENTFELQFAPSPAAASDARQAARTFLDGASVSQAVAADLELAASELLSNAVEQEPKEPIRLTISVTPEGVQLSVANQTTREQPVEQWRQDRSDASMTSGPRERGWGLEIVQALSDHVSYDVLDGWTHASCYRRHDRPGN
ncbi:MAG: ATP-binding protein [Actinomycetota bacterium]